MATVDENTINNALVSVIDPQQNRDVVSAGMISGLVVENGHVLITIEVDPNRGPDMEELRLNAERAIRDIPGVQSVKAMLTAQRKASKSQPMGGHANPLHVMGGGMGKQSPSALPADIAPDVTHIIAVASGKGGVGKSTVAANLATAMAMPRSQGGQGLRVGLMDADIYGPSVPRLMGLRDQKPTQDGNKIKPFTAHNVTVMSMGFLVDEASPIIWRGPMVQSAVLQLLRDVEWGPLDVLIVDMPPGTGDAQLTMAQKVPLSGAVIVSTPQDIALLDAVKGIHMFQKVGVPILGLIENMSHFCCPNCDHISPIFGHGGAVETAQSMGIDVLGEIPLHGDIRTTSDGGTPIVIHDQQSPHAQAFITAAQKMMHTIYAKHPHKKMNK